MFGWLWKRIHQWLSCSDSEDSPSSEGESAQNHCTIATAETTQSPEGFINDIASNPADSTPDDLAHDDESRQCRICYGQFSQVDPLLSPCQCSGSLKYIHSSCLRTWIETRLKSGSTVSAATRCEVCTGEFKDHNNQQGLKVNVLEDIIWISFDLESLELEIIGHLLLRTPSLSPSSSFLMYNFHYMTTRRRLINGMRSFFNSSSRYGT